MFSSIFPDPDRIYSPRIHWVVWGTTTLRQRRGIFVYYEETKRELKSRLLHECRYNERLKVRDEGSIREGLEHLKIETKLIKERFASLFLG